MAKYSLNVKSFRISCQTKKNKKMKSKKEMLSKGLITKPFKKQEKKLPEVFSQTLKKGYFFDWLSITQVHQNRVLPVVSQVTSKHRDNETGEEWVTESKLSHKGSFSSHLTIRSDGSRVTITGNPSRFNRPDNLIGFNSLDDCIEVYNQVLHEFDLPPFSKNDDLIKIWDQQKQAFRYLNNGAEIQQVHVTKNFYVGEGNEDAFIGAFSPFPYRSKPANVYPNLKTVDWLVGSKRLYMKVYNKYHSLAKERKKPYIRDKYSEIELAYYDKVTNYCKEAGLVRLEYEYKSDYLNDRNLRYYGLFDVNLLLDFHFIEDCMDKLSVNVDIQNVSDDLLMLGIVNTRKAANTTENYFFQWLHGKDVKAKLSTSNFYVHKKRLLELGYDISLPINVSTLTTRLNKIQTIDVREMEFTPTWYREPKIVSF